MSITPKTCAKIVTPSTVGGDAEMNPTYLTIPRRRLMPREDLWKLRYREKGGTINYDQAQKDTSTLAKFGATAIAYCPGAAIETPGRGRVTADIAGWNWLVKILEDSAPGTEKVDNE
jgi:hypothetical protein